MKFLIHKLKISNLAFQVGIRYIFNRPVSKPIFNFLKNKKNIPLAEKAMKNFLKNYVINPGVFRGDIPQIIAQDQQAAVNSMVHGLFRVYPNLSKESKKKILEIYADKSTIRVKKIGRDMKKKLGYFPPVFITITPTNQCNLNCKGCYYGGFKKGNKIEGLTYEQLDDILN